MSSAILLAEAKAFLRLDHDHEDGLIATLIDSATSQIETETGQVLSPLSPASLRLCVLILVAQGFEDRLGQGIETSRYLNKVLSPYRQVRL